MEKRKIDVGMTFSSSAAPFLSTPTPTLAPNPVSTLVVATTSAVDATSAVNPLAIATSTPVSSSQKSDEGGLSTGAKAGIAVGAVVIVLLAIGIALLLWRRKRKSPQLVSPETSSGGAVGALDGDRHVGQPGQVQPLQQFQTEVKPPATTTTTTAVVFPHELSAEQAQYAAGYADGHGKPALAPELEHDPRTTSRAWTSSEQNTVGLGPSTANTELAGVLISEISASSHPTSTYDPQYQGYAEVDSNRHSHMTTPVVPELGHPSRGSHHELLASPSLAGSFPKMQQSFSPAQELSSSPALAPVTFSSVPQTAAMPTGGGMASTDHAGGDDAELARMKAEIEAVRAEKERIMHLQALEARERELSQKIVQRELSRGP